MRSASAARMSSRCSPRRTSPASPPEEKVSQYRYDPTAFRQVFEHHFTFLDGFLRNVHRYAGRLALADPATGRSWTYARLGAEVDALAAGLAARGLGPPLGAPCRPGGGGPAPAGWVGGLARGRALVGLDEMIEFSGMFQ